MTEYIDREYVLKCMEDSYKSAGISAEAKAKMTRWLNKAPAADVRPVVRGKWIKPTRVPDSMLDECSVCGFDTGAYTFNFCPNCGADMREESLWTNW